MVTLLLSTSALAGSVTQRTSRTSPQLWCERRAQRPEPLQRAVRTPGEV